PGHHSFPLSGSAWNAASTSLLVLALLRSVHAVSPYGVCHRQSGFVLGAPSLVRVRSVPLPIIERLEFEDATNDGPRACCRPYRRQQNPHKDEHAKPGAKHLAVQDQEF